MTEKRFIVDKSGDFTDTKTGNCIVDFGYSFNGMDCKLILDLLNSLNDENEQLKKENKKLQDEYDLWIYNSVGCEYDSLKEENEQLKQFKDKTFDLFDKEIIRYEEVIEVLGKQVSDGGAMRFYTKMLKILRKELQMND